MYIHTYQHTYAKSFSIVPLFHSRPGTEGWSNNKLIVQPRISAQNLKCAPLNPDLAALINTIIQA